MRTQRTSIHAGDIIEYDRLLWLVRTEDSKRHTLVRVTENRREEGYTVDEHTPKRVVAIVHLSASAVVVQSFGN